MVNRIYIALILILCLAGVTQPVYGFWIWTPESGKWENPKYAAKDTPEEQMQYAMSYYDVKNFKAAIKEFKRLIKHYPLAKEAPTAQYYIGRIMEEADNPYMAFKAYQKVIDLYPYTELVDEVIEREFNLGTMFFEGKKFKVLGPLSIPAKDKAIEILKTVSDNAPYGKYAEPSIFKAGLAYQDIADYENAIKMFKDIIDKYPSSDLVDKARYQLAECSKLLALNPDYDQAPTTLAREEFEDFLKKYPDSEMSQEAKEIVDRLKEKEAQSAFNTAEFYESRNMPESAAIYYKDIIQNYPDTEWAKFARGRLNAIEKK